MSDAAERKWAKVVCLRPAQVGSTAPLFAVASQTSLQPWTDLFPAGRLQHTEDVSRALPHAGQPVASSKALTLGGRAGR